MSLTFPLCVHLHDVSLHVQISSSYKHSSQIELALNERSHFDLNASAKSLSLNIVSLGITAVRFQHVNFGGRVQYSPHQESSCLAVGISNIKVSFFGSEIPSRQE